MTASQTRFDPAAMAADFRQIFAATMPGETLDSIVARLAAQPPAPAANTAYGADCGIFSIGILTRCQSSIKGGKDFVGYAFGVTVPLGGVFFGHVYTDDIGKMYAETASFALIATPVYTSLIFFDEASKTLGSLQAGGLALTAGGGGGKGSWS